MDTKTTTTTTTPKMRAIIIFQKIRPFLLVIFLLLSIAVGIATGVLMRQNGVTENWTNREMTYFRFPGDILMRMLKALVLPLIVSSLISGLASLDTTTSGKIGLYSVVYYMFTTVVAVIIGIVLVTTITPGLRAQVDNNTATNQNTEAANMADSFLDLLRNIFPDNFVEAAFRQTRSKQIPIINSSYYDVKVIKEDGVNILGLVVFSLALGIAVAKLGEVGKPFAKACLGLAEATMILVTAAIWFSPIGILFLIASEIIRMQDPLVTLYSLGWYMLTVLTGLLVHGFFILPLIYFLIVRRNPYKYLFRISQAFLTAFGTASSSATLPVTYRCLEENLKIDRRVTRFMLPIGATINMDGTALYEAVAAIFIAQANGLSLNAAQIVAVSLTATLASIGAASVPQAGLVTMVIVLSAVGLPPEEVTKILAIDWLLDRFRTTVNVEGDAIGAGIVSHLCRKQLSSLPSPSSITDDPPSCDEPMTIIVGTIPNGLGTDKNIDTQNRFEDISLDDTDDGGDNGGDDNDTLDKKNKDNKYFNGNNNNGNDLGGCYENKCYQDYGNQVKNNNDKQSGDYKIYNVNGVNSSSTSF